jgi:hypothetical protein
VSDYQVSHKLPAWGIAREQANGGVCPTCRGPLRDLRDAVPLAVDALREGMCFWWADDGYTCVSKRAQK